MCQKPRGRDGKNEGRRSKKESERTSKKREYGRGFSFGSAELRAPTQIGR